MIKKNICVYCASSNSMDASFYTEARTLGKLMAEEAFGLVYGGGNVGLMGELAKSVHEHNGHVYGVIPRSLKEREGIAYEIADELVITESMSERKRLMFERSQAFITLAGGIGTLEELMETLTLKQLGYHSHPMVIVNTNGFYDTLFDMLNHLLEQRAVRPSYTSLFEVVETAEEAISYIAAQQD